MPPAPVPLPMNALASLRSLSDLASLYHDLGYPSDTPESFEPLDIGLEGAAPLVRHATLITDLEDSSLLLQHWHFELREPLTAASVRRVTEDFMKRPGEYLLTFSNTASNYASIQFVKPRREAQEGGKTLMRLSKLTVTPARPTAHDLSLLRAIAIRPGSSALDANARQREAFSVERVTQRFFDTYTRLFRHVREVIRAENLGAVIQTSPLRTVQPKPAENSQQDDNEKALHAFTQRLLGRLLFLYFIQKKGWLDGEEGYITALYQECQGRGGNFYRDALEPLYFGTLNESDPRAPGLPTEAQIPYLNGSLFEREYPIDTVLNLPNSLFDPMRAEVDRADPGGILHVLNSFNFTVGESAALETDISLDPEMLGKVFENLMEEEDAAKSGTFYTPRSIVQFMAEETLTRYLADHSGLPQNRLLPLCADDSDTHELSFAEAKKLKDVLADVRVLDPAVGTASMLVGFLNAMIQVRRSLEARLMNTVIPGGSPAIAQWKREYIQHCLYGVDIKHEAIEIARLRLWLSLVVDATEPEPLPNLDYKLMAGDGLLETVDGSPLIKEQTKIVGGQGVVTAKADEIGRLHDRFYREQDYEKKRVLRARIQQCERELFEADISDRITNRSAEISQLNRQIADSRQSASTVTRLLNRKETLDENLKALLQQQRKVLQEKEPLPFFLHNVHFGEVMNGEGRGGNGGFDIVLGNPPYVSIGNMPTAYKTALKNAFPDVASGRADLYVYFFQKGLNLLREGGRLAYITPNKYMRAGYGKKLREILSSKTQIELLADFGDLPVFDAATYPLISMVKKSTPSDGMVLTLPERTLKIYIGEAVEAGLSAVREKLGSFNIYAKSLTLNKSAKDFTEDDWFIEDARIGRLKNRLAKDFLSLKDILASSIVYGIKSGSDKILVIDEDTRNKIVGEGARSNEVLNPFLTGRGLSKWKVSRGNLFIILTTRGIDISLYPSLKSYLEANRRKLSERATVDSHEWYELQQPQEAYFQHYRRPKVVYGRFQTKPKFSYDSVGLLHNDAIYSFAFDEWIVPILNSKMGWFLVSQYCYFIRGGYQLITENFERISIPSPTSAQIAVLETFTDDSRLPELNALVYDLYGLNADERALVEELTAGAYGDAGAGESGDDTDEAENQ